jgi:hypothetical protein
MKRRVLVKTMPFHAFEKEKEKEKSKWCPFERHHRSSSSPGRAEDRRRRSYYVPLQRHYFHLSLPSFAQKYTTQPIPTLTCYHDEEKRRDATPCSGWGGCAEATPRHPALHLDETGQSGLSLFLLIVAHPYAAYVGNFRLFFAIFGFFKNLSKRWVKFG